MPNFTAPIAGMTYSNTRDLGDRFCQCLTETGSVPLSVVVNALHLLVGSVMMEIALAALQQIFAGVGAAGVVVA